MYNSTMKYMFFGIDRCKLNCHQTTVYLHAFKCICFSFKRNDNCLYTFFTFLLGNVVHLYFSSAVAASVAAAAVVVVVAVAFLVVMV